MNVQGQTILVTERNANIRELLRRELEKDGLFVHVASDAATLRERLLEETSYALAVLDEDLPGDGESALELITRLAPGLPVILHAFPGNADGEEADKAARLVEKSGDFECLRRAVMDMIATRPADREESAAGD